MFCSKCGTKAIDGAAFCQKCGAKLIQDNKDDERSASALKQKSGEMAIPVAKKASGSEQNPVKEEESLFKGKSVPRPTLGSLKTETVPIESIMKTVQGADVHKESSSITGNDTDIYALLKQDIDKCPAIKSAKQVKRGVRLHGKIYNHTVRFVNGHAFQARLRSVLAFPFSILYGVLVGLLCFVTWLILAEFVKYGSVCIEYYHGILFSLCCLVMGAVISTHAFVGRKEKETVKAYVREILNPKQINLFEGKWAGTSAIKVVVAVVMVVAGIIVLPFNLPKLQESIEYPGELLFGGLPAARILEMTQKDIESEFGKPNYTYSNMATGDDCYSYTYSGSNSINQVIYSKENGKVIYVRLSSTDCSCNGKKLNKSLERVSDILSEGYGESYYSYGVYGSIHNGFYYDDVYFGETPTAEEYLVQQEFEDGRDFNYHFVPLYAYGEEYYDSEWMLNGHEKQDYKIDLIIEIHKLMDDLNGVYYVCLYTDEWVEIVNARKNAIDLSYHGESIADWIGSLPEDAYDVFGWPDNGTIVDGYLYEGGEYFGYTDGVIFVMDYQTGQISWIIGDTGSIMGNGYTLDKTRDELIEILGTPTREEYAYNDMDDTSSYYMQYTLDSVELLINMPDAASMAETFIISQIVE